VLGLLAEAWPYVVALGAVAAVLPIALVTAGWGVPAMVGAALGTVLRRYGLARRAAAPRIEG